MNASIRGSDARQLRGREPAGFLPEIATSQLSFARSPILVGRYFSLRGKFLLYHFPSSFYILSFVKYQGFLKL